MTEISNIKGLEQNRAKFAYECAKTASNNQNKKKDYKSYAKKLPMMIKTNGLGAALSFALSKSKTKEGQKTAWGFLYDDLDNWLRKDHKVWLLGKNPPSDLSEAAINLDSSEYRAVTVEVLAFLTWLRRFAEGLIEGEAE